MFPWALIFAQQEWNRQNEESYHASYLVDRAHEVNRNVDRKNAEDAERYRINHANPEQSSENEFDGIIP